MGPVHGAIVNWCGHKYGYKNFDNGDASRNSLPFDFLTGGELFQNNHHKFAMSPNFAVRTVRARSYVRSDANHECARNHRYARSADWPRPHPARTRGADELLEQLLS